MIKRTSIFALTFLVLFMFQSVFAQANTEVSQNEKPQAKLLDILKKNANAEYRSLLIDGLITEIQNNENSKGAIIVYCGKVCKYGEIEAHIKGIKLKLGVRGLDLANLYILDGGYKEEQITELWLIPENACPPMPKSDVKIEVVKFKGKFKGKFVHYDCCDYP